MTQRLNWYGKQHDGIASLQQVEAWLHGGVIDKRLLSLVKVRASQINGCAYCLHMHGAEARQAGERDERLLLLDAWRESAMFNPRERAALAWTESLTNISLSHAPDEVYEEVRRHFSEDELIALSIGIAMINAWNRLSIGFRAQHPADITKAA